MTRDFIKELEDAGHIIPNWETADRARFPPQDVVEDIEHVISAIGFCNKCGCWFEIGGLNLFCTNRECWIEYDGTTCDDAMIREII